MLHYISVDIGLDDLVLFDLRKLDPPPALGANLIMIIGTARSVKHLNVSADRFSRWLRSTYKLQPDADGLLGRNELKIKLRRKAKRARLASNAGTTLDNHDDGITTGWICVNAGVVDSGSGAPNKQRDDNFVGFGEVAEGTRVVVQMLTEEKRAEVDLEGLWTQTINRISRKENQIPRRRLDASPEEVGPAHHIQATSPSDRDLRASHRPLNRLDHGQRRAIHTCRQLQSPDTSLQHDKPVHSANPPQSKDTEGISRKPTNPLTSPTSSSVSNVTPLFQFLSDLSEEEAVKQLGLGPDDRNSTQFLDIFHKTLSHDDDSTFALSRLELIRRAIVLCHPGYTKNHLYDQFHECIVSGHDISEHQMWQILDTLLLYRPLAANVKKPTARIPDAEMELALQVLNHMSLRGMDVLSGRVLSSLFNGVSFQAPVVPVQGRDPLQETTHVPVHSRELKKVSHRQTLLQQVIDAGNIRLESDDYAILLRTVFNQKNYPLFWTLWQKISLQGIRRSEKLYALFFTLHAERGNQRSCQRNLSSWASMLERENPPVALRGEVAKAVMKCILVVDPAIQRDVEEDSPGELASLWKQCVEGLEAEQREAET